MTSCSSCHWASVKSSDRAIALASVTAVATADADAAVSDEELTTPIASTLSVPASTRRRHGVRAVRQTAQREGLLVGAPPAGWPPPRSMSVPSTVTASRRASVVDADHVEPGAGERVAHRRPRGPVLRRAALVGVHVGALGERPVPLVHELGVARLGEVVGLQSRRRTRRSRARNRPRARSGGRRTRCSGIRSRGRHSPTARSGIGPRHDLVAVDRTGDPVAGDRQRDPVRGLGIPAVTGERSARDHRAVAHQLPAAVGPQLHRVGRAVEVVRAAAPGRSSAERRVVVARGRRVEVHVDGCRVVRPAPVADSGDRVAGVPGTAHAGDVTVDLLPKHPAVVVGAVGLEAAVAVPGVERGRAGLPSARVDEVLGRAGRFAVGTEDRHRLVGVVEVVLPEHARLRLGVEHRPLALDGQRRRSTTGRRSRRGSSRVTIENGFTVTVYAAGCRPVRHRRRAACSWRRTPAGVGRPRLPGGELRCRPRR